MFPVLKIMMEPYSPDDKSTTFQNTSHHNMGYFVGAITAPVMRPWIIYRHDQSFDVTMTYSVTNVGKKRNKLRKLI